MKATPKLLAAGLMSLMTLTISASPLTPAEALGRLEPGGALHAVSTKSRLQLAKTCMTDGIATTYIFAPVSGNGFVVLSADDCCPALLGYSDAVFSDEKGDFAPGFKYWLDEMGRQILYASTLDTPRFTLAPRPARDRIPQMCTTRWGQTEPYYNKCPIYKGERCVTGCAATSIAQVMKYHNWPETGEGSHQYRWHTYTLKINFAETTFDWDNMLNNYRSSASDAEKDAVAVLMKAVGYGIDMNYSPDGSGATAPPMGRVLAENLKYSKSLQYLERDWYSLYDWENVIYQSLKDGCPVIYNGQSGEGGHSFVCDGYSANGFFHINWGWNGMSDGYFLLDVLDPASMGTGGSGSGFNYSQQVFAQVKPDPDGTSIPYYQMAIYGALMMETDDRNVVVKSLLYNPGCLTIPGRAFGIAATPITEFGMPIGETEYFGYLFGQNEEGEDEGLSPLYGWSEVSFDVSELPVGRYIVKPFYQDPQEVIHDMRGNLGATREYILTVKEDQNILRSVTAVVPELADVNFPDWFSEENSIQATGTLINPVNLSFTASLSAIIMSEDGSTTLAKSESRSYPLEADQDIPFEYGVSLENHDNLVPGTIYKIAMCTSDGRGGEILLTEPQDIMFAPPAGIRTTGEESLEETRCYYNMLGVKVAEAKPGENRPTLPSGIYIVKSPAFSLKIVI